MYTESNFKTLSVFNDFFNLIGIQEKFIEKNLAEIAIKHFTSITQLLSAPSYELKSLFDEEALVNQIELYKHLFKLTLMDNQYNYSLSLKEKCIRSLINIDHVYSQVECLKVLFFDTNDDIITLETLHVGTFKHVPFDEKLLLNRAIELNSKDVILVHNHVSKNITPSKEDIDMSLKLKQYLHKFDINLHQSYVYSYGGLYPILKKFNTFL